MEQKLFSCDEVFVYKIPPLRTVSGHRAEDWKLESPLFTGCLIIHQVNDRIRIRLFSYENPATLSMSEENLKLFAETYIELQAGQNITPFVDSVIDSSRYYVVRIKDESSTKVAFVGIGFREREVSFDFKTVLNDYVKYIDRMALAADWQKHGANMDLSHTLSDAPLEDDAVVSSSNVSTMDLTLHSNVKLNLKLQKKSQPRMSDEKRKEEASQAEDTKNKDEEDWGDFESA